MTQNFNDIMPAMSWTVGAIWRLVVLILILEVATLVKYLFVSK